MARTPVMAAGGIVLRQEETPLIAVVRLRKRNEWVLPKGKLDDGETARDAAEREVLEETGHDVSVHEFLGTLVYESGRGSKVVHYWRMEASGGQVHELMRDIRAVDWLPLDQAVERLSRGYERAFLANVGPLALETAALARRPRPKQPPLEKRRERPAAAPRTIAKPVLIPLQLELATPAMEEDGRVVAANDMVEVEPPVAVDYEAVAEVVQRQPAPDDIRQAAQHDGKSAMQKVREWWRGLL